MCVCSLSIRVCTTKKLQVNLEFCYILYTLILRTFKSTHSENETNESGYIVNTNLFILFRK